VYDEVANEVFDEMQDQIFQRLKIRMAQIPSRIETLLSPDTCESSITIKITDEVKARNG